MKRILFRLFFVFIMLIFVLSAVKISRNIIRKSIKMTSYRFTRKNAVECKVNSFFRALKSKNYKLAKTYMKNRDDLEKVVEIINGKIKCFFIIKSIKISKDKAHVNLLIQIRHNDAEKLGFLDEKFCEIVVEFSNNEWRIFDIKDFLRCMKNFNNIETEKVRPYYNQGGK